MYAKLQKAEGEVQPLTEEATQLRQELDQSAKALKAARDQIELLHSNAATLSQELARLKAQPAANPNTDPTVILADRVALMKSNLERIPERRIPELPLADENDWLEAAKLATTDSDEDMRKALSLLRTAAKLKFGRELGLALRNYTQANHGNLPTDLFQLKPFFTVTVDDAVFQRWEIHVTGNTGDPGFDPNRTVAREKSEMLPDSFYDNRVRAGLNGTTMEGSKAGGFPRLKNYELE